MPDPESNENKWRKNMSDANVKISIQRALNKIQTQLMHLVCGVPKNTTAKPPHSHGCKNMQSVWTVVSFSDIGKPLRNHPAIRKDPACRSNSGHASKRPHVVATPDFQRALYLKDTVYFVQMPIGGHNCHLRKKNKITSRKEKQNSCSKAIAAPSCCR